MRFERQRDEDAERSALLLAINSAGSMGALARLLGIRRQAVTQMLRRGRIPVDRVLEIEEVTGVSRHTLRPDIYPRP